MQTRIAVIVTLALAGAAAVVVIGLARAAARRLAGYLDGVERFATAVSGCPPPVSASRHQHRPEHPCLRPSPNAPTSSRTAPSLPPSAPAPRRRGRPPHEH